MRKLSVSMRKSELIPGWIYFALQLTVIPVVLVLVNELLGKPLDEAGQNIVFFFINFACAAFIFRRFLIANGKTALKRPLRCLAITGIGFAAYQQLTTITSVIIALIYPDFANVNDANIGVMVKDNLLLMAITTVVLVPITEELFYRGLIFRGLYNRSKVAAYLVSTLVFAAIHVVGYVGLYEWEILALCFLQYLPAGFCLACAYAHADSIWPPILIHTTNNFLAILAMAAM